MMRVLSVLLLAGLAFMSPVSGAVRILCLGDSITEGAASFQVYRPLLAQKLQAAGIDAEFVGPKKDPVGLAHGGYGGKSVEQVLAEYRKFHADYPADVLILHSGHNHTVEEKPIPGILRATREMIDLARTDNPRVIVLLALVIPSGKLPKYEYIPALNEQLAALGKELGVTVVDQAEGFDWRTDTVADKVHPNAAGAGKMAGKFFQALQPSLAAASVPDEIADLPETQQEALALANDVVVYKTVDGVELEMHVFIPDSPGEKRPGILYIHGGGWVGGDPSVHAFESLLLSRRGMVAATIRYRLLPGSGKNRFGIARSPADCLADAKSAMRYFRKNALRYRMDPDRIAAAGGSAGGHLAAALNTIEGYDDIKDDLSVSPQAQALVLLYPAFDLIGGWGSGAGQCRKAGIDPAAFSPARIAGKNFPPTLILVGNQDPVSPPAVNDLFLKRMKENGGQVELFTYSGKAHKLFDRNKKDLHFRSYLIHSQRFFQELGWIEKRPLPELPAIDFTSNGVR